MAGTTLTIRHLAEPIKQRLRVRAAQHGRSMEAEAREILASAVGSPVLGRAGASLAVGKPGLGQGIRGIWAGRGPTDAVMAQLRSED